MDLQKDNITFFFEDIDIDLDVAETNSLELEQMMLEFSTEEYNMNTNDVSSSELSSSELSYFIKRDFYLGNYDSYYNEEYKLKDLMKICQYYGIIKSIKALKKQDIITNIVNFEKRTENYEIVEKRHKMWAYMTELLEDPKMKGYLIF